MSERVLLDELTPTQLRRVRCLEVACLLFAGHNPSTRIAVARWIYAGVWPDAE